MLRILHVAPTFWPATWWGGPIFSTKALCDGVAAAPDAALRVLTTDSAGQGRRVPPETAAQDPYPVIRARRRAGASISPELLARLPGEIARADLVHVTAAYSFPTLPALAAARRAGKPVVWSPRGALQATADWQNAPRRGLKRRFERLAQRLRPEDTVLHVTSPEERDRSRANLPGIETALIPNSVEIPAAPPPRAPRPEGRLRLLFLSRLHEKKGLDLLLDAMDRLPPGISLEIHGDGEPAFVAALRARIGETPRIRLMGPADAAAKAAAFARADLFVLPSWSENFGIVVAEALAHGVPALTTTRTPWTDLEARGCGRAITLGQDDLAEEIRALAAADLPAMGAAGRVWMAQDFSADAMCAAFLDLYRRLAAAPAEAAA